MKKLLFVLLAGASINLYAQDNSTDVKFIGLTKTYLNNPLLIGKAGDNYILMDTPDDAGTPVYIFNASFQLLKKTWIPAEAYSAKYSKIGHANRLVWIDQQKDSLRLNTLSITESGETELEKHQVISVGRYAHRQWINDKRNNYQLFFSLYTDTLQHLFIQGELFDSVLTKIKTITQSFDFNIDLDRIAGTLLDVEGNVHIVTYDRLTNYRESVNVNINTMPVNEAVAYTETFHFDKIKFYDLALFDELTDHQVQLAGFYYDGNNKEKKGVAALRFPYNRINKVEQKFNLFSATQRDYLSAGMDHIGKHDDVFEYLKLKDIIEADGHILLSAWMLDIPNSVIVKDREYEQFKNMDSSLWVRTGHDGTPFDNMSGPQKNIPDRINNEQLLLTESGNTYRLVTLTTNSNRPIRTAVFGSPGGRSAVDRKLREKNLPKRLPATPRKVVFFSMDKEGNLDWLQSAGSNSFIYTANYTDSLLDYPLLENGQWYFPHYRYGTAEKSMRGQQKKNATVFSIVNVNRLGVKNNEVLTGMNGEYHFFRPIKISAGNYLSPYQNIQSRQSGLAVVQIKQ